MKVNVYESFGLIWPLKRVVGKRGARGSTVVNGSGEEKW